MQLTRWTKGNHDRVYIKGLLKRLGFDWELYGTGNISSATYRGENLSNSRMRKLFIELGNVYFDVKTGKLQGFCQQNVDKIIEVDFAPVIEEIKKWLQEQ